MTLRLVSAALYIYGPRNAHRLRRIWLACLTAWPAACTCDIPTTTGFEIWLCRIFLDFWLRPHSFKCARRLELALEDFVTSDRYER